MRDILFRGKRVDSGKWIEGFYFHFHKTTYCFADDDDGNNDIHRIAYEEMSDWNLPNRHLMTDVDPETIGQYTGLTDKNGKRIFEGDIIKETTDNELLVVEGTTAWGFDFRYVDEEDAYTTAFDIGIDDNAYLRTSIVVGNIYDNPELLERKENKNES